MRGWCLLRLPSRYDYRIVGGCGGLRDVLLLRDKLTDCCKRSSTSHGDRRRFLFMSGRGVGAIEKMLCAVFGGGHASFACCLTMKRKARVLSNLQLS